MYKIGYIIATKDRSYVMQEWLESLANHLKENDICVYILDGSEDDKTKIIVDKYKNDNIIYSQYPNTSIAWRTIKGLQMADCEYICICGDCARIKLQYLSHILSLMEEKYDIIEFTFRDKKHIGKKVYNNIAHMFEECAWDMVVYAYTFLRLESYREIEWDTYEKLYGDSIFFYMIYYFDYHREELEFKGYYEALRINDGSRIKKKSFWRKNTFEVWGKEWIKIIEKLKAVYNPYKDKVIMDHGVYGLDFDKKIGFVRLRSEKVFDYKIFQEYSNEIARISPLEKNKIIKISKMPIWISKLVIWWVDLPKNTRKIIGKYMPKKMKEAIKNIIKR